MNPERPNIRQAILTETRLRRRRTAFLPAELFGEAGWDILLALALDRLDGRRSSISGACFLSTAPPTTALRHIGRLIDAGLAMRSDDRSDGRRTWLVLTDAGMAAVTSCFESALVAVSAAPAPAHTAA